MLASMLVSFWSFIWWPIMTPGLYLDSVKSSRKKVSFPTIAVKAWNRALFTDWPDLDHMTIPEPITMVQKAAML